MTYKRFTSGMLVALVCSGVALSSLAQEVYSPNVVGFQKVTAVSTNQGGLIMGSAPFNRDVPNIDNVVGTNGFAGTSETTADNLYMYNPTGGVNGAGAYEVYYLRSSANPAINRHWITSAGLATNVYILPGDGYFYRNRATSNTTIILAGEVVNDVTITNIIVPGLQMLSYPFNTAIRMTDMSLTNGKTAGSGGESIADNIVLYEPTNRLYTVYWLNASANPANDRKWRTSSGLATNVFIQQGQSFWYRNRLGTNFRWVEARPYTF